MAQFGRAGGLGPSGREFESLYADTYRINSPLRGGKYKYLNWETKKLYNC